MPGRMITQQEIQHALNVVTSVAAAQGGRMHFICPKSPERPSVGVFVVVGDDALAEKIDAMLGKPAGVIALEDYEEGSKLPRIQ